MKIAFVDWLYRALRWFRADPLAWSTIVTLMPLVLLATIGLCLPWRTGDLLRYAGLVLQLLGIGTVAKNLIDKGVLFNLPRLRDMARRSVANFPKWGIHGRSNTADASDTIVASGHVQAFVWRGYADKSTAERVDAIIANLEELRTQHARDIQQLKSEHDALQSEVVRHRNERTQEDADLRRLVTGLGTSSIHLDWAGIIWLSVGVVLSTIPADLAHWFQILF